MANIVGLHDKKKAEQAAEDDDGQDFYVGGAGQNGGSGLNVIDPSQSSSSGDPMEQLVAKAQAQGASGGEAGSGGVAKRTITVYSNGFTVDDGPLRTLDEPANKQFIMEMMQGRVPTELGPNNVDVVLNDKRGEEYVKPAYTAYSGEGQTIGGGTEVSAGALAGAADDETEAPVVDDAKPKAMIAVRLHNGKRIRATLNLDHTIRHLQALIAAEGAGGAPYVLMSGYPPAQLTDFSQTIEAAGLNGAQVTQKLA